MPHVDEGTLHTLLDGALRAHEPGRADRVEAHLETCADCRARLEEAAALKDTASDILGALGGAAARPDFDEVRARAAAADEVGERPGFTAVRADFQQQVRWTRGLAWAATIVVALGAGYIARDLAGPRGAMMERQADRTEAAAPDAPPADAPAGGDADAAAGGEAPSPSEAPRRGRAVAEEVAEGEAAEGQLAGERIQDQAAGGEADQAAGAQADRAADVDAVHQAAGALPVEQQTEPAAGGARPETGLELEAVARHPVAFDRAVEVTGAAAEPVVEWVEVDVAEAEHRLGGPVLLLPRARISSVLAAAGGQPMIRSLQLLPGDVTVQVVQQPAASAQPDVDDGVAKTGEADAPVQAAAAPEARQLQADVVTLENVSVAKVTTSLDSALTSQLHTITVHRADASLVITGPFTPDMLTTLAVSAQPRP